MKRILYIATSNMFQRTGGGIANLAIYNSLVRHFGDNIDVLHYGECLPVNYPSNFIPVPSSSAWDKILGLLKGSIHRFHPWLDNFLHDHAVEYSHCIINTSILGDYIYKIKSYGIKVAVVHHNYEVEFQMDNRRPSTFYGISGHLIKNNELASYREADMNLFLSEDDINIFHDEYSNDNAVPEYVIGIFEPDDDMPNLKIDSPLFHNKLAICGSLESVQTIKGIRHFKENCLQSLSKLYGSEYKLIIAGRNPGKSILNLASLDNNIKVIPNPTDMSRAIQDCGVFLCPTNVGGGIKLRILEGLKMGMPILTHEVSARGYNDLHKYNWFQIYNDEDSFVNGLSVITKEIKNNGNLRWEIFNVYKDHYSASKGDYRFTQAMKSFLNVNPNCYENQK